MFRHVLPLAYCFALALVASPLKMRAAPADTCAGGSRSGWISWVEVEARLREQGLRLTQLRISDVGCYDIASIDTRGDQHIVRMHPVTGKIVNRVVVKDSGVRLPWRSGFKPD
jgi:hypothetical protein